ncbi:hypothetical protein FB45DRAFT_113204 [Roridomyces roridus]|uniref:DUF6534 domain-containing protein n=1 Tax=Roridomyces roridus TaxID=1738132 RepID=A0AAD7BKZ4_9AGAR|nr:hypothetical protein FB45DRAFT_113204 [Roridomyces roridus]
MAPLDNTLGVEFIGVIVSATLYGVSVVQTWWYATHTNDNWPLKTLVAAVMLCDTAHQVLISHTVYYYAITHYSDPTQLVKIIWSLLVEVLFNGLTALLVQSFLTVRVWRLSNGNKWLTGISILLVMGEFGCVLAYLALSLPMKTFAELERLHYLSMAVNALAAAGDLFIAGSLVILLRRSRTGFQRSDTMIRKLVIFAVNTGVITTSFAIASLISIATAKNTFIYILFYFCMGRLYANSLLATLNARKMIRGAADGVNTTSENGLSLREISKSKSGASFSLGSKRPNISIKIDTTQEFNRDVEEGDKGSQSTAAVRFDLSCSPPRTHAHYVTAHSP